VKIGENTPLYAFASDKTAYFDKIDYLFFSAAPDASAPAGVPGIMYVDDIMITTVQPLVARAEFPSSDVSPSQPLTVSFSGAVEAADVKNALTISEKGVPVPNNITVIMSGDKKTAVITVTGGLKYNTTYTLRLNNSFSDPTGAKMSEPLIKTFVTLFSDSAYVNSFKGIAFSNAGGSCPKAEAAKVTVTLQVTNPTSSSESPYVIVAAYTARNQMLGYRAMNVLNIPANGKSADAVFEIDNLPPGTYAVKAFVWNNQAELKLNGLPFVYNQ
jgi:hypothetical protein